MNEDYMKVLKKIKEKAEETTDGFLVSVSLDVRSEKRAELVKYMEQEGYIEKVDFIGKSNISCKVTQKLLESEF
ncbi:hypothetical protein D1155_13700 [Anaerotruncus sp. 80]|uniref:Uncharacterized protein n=1 Tax=Anaerotruncus colihominis TaxID=169435 RepID=A0A845QKH7_9FIRM|nr:MULTISPECIES: hypothetical protein [Anaerotruncus]NBH62702.1 hypothetical protein [Anaerotruncus colihominis]NCF03357.1 hypothetical protein [Anaerotruncus sp. 80]